MQGPQRQLPVSLRSLHCKTSESNSLAKIFDHGCRRCHGWTRIEKIAQDDFYPCDPCNPWSSLTAWFGCGCAALGTLPNLEVIYGHFLTHKVMMPLANLLPGQPTFAEVIKTEEKGSDVNLATFLLLDGFHNSYDTAVLVTNDSDLLEPIRVVRSEFGKRVGLLNPQRNKRVALDLLPHLDFYKPIRKGVLGASQFPNTIQDRNGTFHRPAGW